MDQGRKALSEPRQSCIIYRPSEANAEVLATSWILWGWIAVALTPQVHKND